MAPQPTKEDKFSFVLWTVGWRARRFLWGEDPGCDPVSPLWLACKP